MNRKMQVDCLHLGMATIARRPIKTGTNLRFKL